MFTHLATLTDRASGTNGSAPSHPTPLSPTLLLIWPGGPSLLSSGTTPQTPAKQGVRGVSPLSLVERLKNAREAAKLKWNTEWGRA